ncbi:MAG: fatty acid--CoA ligase family protein [Actinomycetota bacterium]|nr:fatty acid--CoA ligase family protein [Actinomycetota bacterium]
MIWLDLIAARADSDEPAVFTDDGVWTGRELLARAGGAIEFLDAIGAPVGSPVVALLTSRPMAFALTIGAAASDRALAPLGPRLTVSELVPCVDALAGEVIITEPEFEGLAHEVAARTGRRVAVLPDLPASGWHPSMVIAPDRPTAILHTSGTTGRPKAVAYTEGKLVARVKVNAQLVDLGPGAVYATASPFHHIAGLGMMFVALGSGAALRPMPRFDIAAWRALPDSGVTHALIVPTMIEMLLDAGELRLPGLRVLQYGASSVHPDTLARAMQALPGVRFVNLFGQTEGSPITALTMADHELAAAGHPHLLTSVGRAAPGVEVVIADPDETGVGEIHARAEHLFRPDADGWLRTGDLGRVDAEGYLYLSGRKGDKIIRGGENVYPLEVEHVLASHPAVAEACVYGVPDRVYGEIVAATVVPAADVPMPTWEELRAFTRERLAGFKVPTRWEAAAELPRNATGKVLRRALIDKAGSE